MKMEEFMGTNNLKNKKTVEKWIEDGLIQGMDQDEKGEWIFSKYAKPPYTEARAKTAYSIYVSIVKGCNKRKGICSKLYGMSEEEFSVYINNLQKEDLISVIEDRGCKFYFPTTKSKGFINNEKGLRKYLKEVLGIIIKNLTVGVIEGIRGKYA
ncbi:MAG: hypothetical protein E7242_04275 [Lachnospiraceae bacterium]|nr:hypothetical protein [Lachnospiraceae bacterium]